jgi:hypothetical protein
MDSTYSSETSVDFQLTTQPCIAEDRTFEYIGSRQCSMAGFCDEVMDLGLME